MCGISGWFNYTRGEPVEAADIEKMKGTIVHRGPDDEGTFIDGPIGLGFRRLSILDLSPAGHQPMSDPDKKIWLIFNGEIYNFQELRAELQAKGCVFRSKSDTEVIVYGYKIWGDDILPRLNGMFGLAIWDVERKRLLLARDRAGIKLVYYKDENGRLLFGSEVRPILAAESGYGELDPAALQLYLRYRYAPSPFTLFKGIKKLAPGTAMIVENGSMRIERFWKFKPRTVLPAPPVDEAEERLLHLYEKSVGRQLVSDVPVGLLLSGGLDSALLLALMKKHGAVAKSFTVGYGADADPDDELADAAATASVLNAPHFASRINQAMFEEVVSKVTKILEEPVATASVVPMYYVCERARKDVTVALIGQGPDELFCGYNRHLGLKLGKYWRAIPELGRDPLQKLLRLFPRKEMLKRGLFSLGIASRDRRFQEVFALLPSDEVDTLFQDGIQTGSEITSLVHSWKDLFVASEGLDELSAFNYLEILSNLPDELLMYADKLSMHHSLELRVPYLDNEIIEYSLQLPASYKVRNLSRKWLHRQVCRHYLPEEIIKRRKRGFSSTVIDQWFRSSVGGQISDLLMDNKSLIYRYLRHDAVTKILENHRRGAGNYYKTLFSLVFLEQWLRNFTRN